MKEDLTYPNAPRHPRRLPTIFTPEEVSRLIDSARNLFHYAMLLTMYSAGLRRCELCKLKVSNIDSGRMVIRIERGKGDVDREVPLNPKATHDVTRVLALDASRDHDFAPAPPVCC